MTNDTQQVAPGFGFAVNRDAWRALGLGRPHDAAIAKLMHEKRRVVSSMRRGRRPLTPPFVAATLHFHPGAFNQLFSITGS